MIIKGIFRRYQKWNPVHPTSGAFWGMGIGIGCGVGWGPGFGPEVVGYVGAGCGVGFSVGITLAGFGIGLPANCLFEAPLNAVRITSAGAIELARSSGLLPLKHFSEDGWSSIGPRISGLQREASERFFKHKNPFGKGLDLSDMNRKFSSQTANLLDHLGRFSGSLFRPRKGINEEPHGMAAAP